MLVVLEAACYHGGDLTLKARINVANRFLSIWRCMVDAAWNKADPSPALMEGTVWEDTHGQEAVKQTRRGMSVANDHIRETVPQRLPFTRDLG